MNSDQVTPEKILQIGMGFFASKALLVAVKMGLFTFLSFGKQSVQAIQEKLGLDDRALYDFLDALVSLGFLEREGIKSGAYYSNSPDANQFLDRNKPSYIGGILEMANNRLYPFWNNLEEALKSGKPQNEAKGAQGSIFEMVYADETKLREFLNAMAGIQRGNFIMFANEFDFSPYFTHCDIGGAGGYLAAQIALNNAHMSCISFDLEPVSPIALDNIRSMGLEERVKVQSGDFFEDNFPKVDVITMGNILHDWGKEDKKMLIRKAYEALPEGGALVIIENIIDNERRDNTFGLLMSLNMLIETEAGYDFSMGDFEELAKEAGFKEVSLMRLIGPTSAAVAKK
ncbi:methyltransferase [Echinicola marina]|uniref:acetylserotonin O-methyltransferase n=1 Tax=Echinicola marina TaxID=2859768 RepID=UPI001CF6D51D|nr:acetylserotonin O-methyltransferase [Echinicola marina]UCS94570.1 methyltransferase [Echinicola marina]